MVWLLTILIGTSDFEDVDYILNDKNEFVLEHEVEEYGKNFLVKDACFLGDTLYMVGGGTRVQTNYGGMDALLMKYKDNELSIMKTYGGQKDDWFTGIVCGEFLTLIGVSRSTDFVSSSSMFQSGFIMETDINGEVITSESISASYDVFLEGVTMYNNVVYAVGYVDKITSKDFLVTVWKNTTLSWEVMEYSRNDKLFDIGIINNTLVAVGSTNSPELDASIKSGVLLYLDENGSIKEYETNPAIEESEYLFIDNNQYGGQLGGVGYRVEENVSYREKAYDVLMGSAFGMVDDTLIVSGVEMDLEEVIPIFFENDILVAQKTSPLHSILLRERIVVDLDKNIIGGVGAERLTIYPEMLQPGMYMVYDALVSEDYTVFFEKRDIEVSHYTNLNAEIIYEPFQLIGFGDLFVNGEEVNSGYWIMEEGLYEVRVNDHVYNVRFKEKPEFTVNPLPKSVEVGSQYNETSIRWLVIPIAIVANLVYIKWYKI